MLLRGHCEIAILLILIMQNIICIESELNKSESVARCEDELPECPMLAKNYSCFGFRRNPQNGQITDDRTFGTRVSTLCRVSCREKYESLRARDILSEDIRYFVELLGG